MMLPVAQLWWLRPVMRAARVGEQRAVVWKRLYFRPLAASLSKFGVGIGPPNVLEAPKPTSSVMIKSTFGSPLGAWTSLGKSGVDSLAVRPILPWNGGSGLGRTVPGPSGFFSSPFFSSRGNTAAGRPLAASQPDRRPSSRATIPRRFMVLCMVSPLLLLAGDVSHVPGHHAAEADCVTCRCRGCTPAGRWRVGA